MSRPEMAEFVIGAGSGSRDLVWTAGLFDSA